MRFLKTLIWYFDVMVDMNMIHGSIFGQKCCVLFWDFGFGTI
jgi:hypothetical protein